MPLKALEACESHLYKAACVFYRARKKEQRMSRTFLWLHLNSPPPQTCTATQEVNYSMAHLCSFVLDCIEMNIKVNLWNEAYDTTAFELNLHKRCLD